MWNCSKSRLIALFFAVLLTSQAQAQIPLQDQTTIVDSQQITVYDSTLPARERNRRITVGLLRSGLPATIEPGQCVQGNSAGTALVFAVCATGGGASVFTGLSDTPNSLMDGAYLRSTATALVFQTAAQVRADIGANDASNLTAGTVADARIPVGIARDSELITAWTGLSDSPSAITAGQCVQGNASGTALIFAACGTGGGTPLTAAANSGLTITGSAIIFAPAGLPRVGTSEVIGRSDDLIIKNESEANDATLVSFQDFLEDIAGDRMNVNTNNRQLDVRADYRGIAQTGSTSYITGDIVRQSSGSVLFWLLAGADGDFTANEIIASGSGWVSLTSGTVPERAWRGEPPLTQTQYLAGQIVEFSNGDLYIYTGADNAEFARNQIAGSSNWTQFDGSGGGGSGITQTQADARYVNIDGDDMSGMLDVTVTGDLSAVTLRAPGDNPPVISTRTDITGAQKAFQASRGTQGTAWFSVEGALGGSNNNPGLAFGTGTSGRDVDLYRGGANILETDDAFRADELRVSGTLATTQTNLGVNDAFVAAAVSNTTLTFTQADGGSADVTLPSGGGGDITGVTAGLGLIGGGSSGTVSLAFRPTEFSLVSGPSAADSFIVIDQSDSGNPKRIPVGTALATFAGLGLGRNGSTANLQLAFNELNTNTSIASGDFIPFYDISTVSHRRITRANLAAQLGVGGGDPFEGLTERPYGAGLPIAGRFVFQASGTNNFVTTDSLLRAFRSERGGFDNTVDYSRGDTVETGTGGSTIFWDASVDIAAGGGAPTLLDPGEWFLLSTHGFWRGEVDTSETYELHEGDTYHVGPRAFIVLDDVGDRTGNSLLGSSNIEEITGIRIEYDDNFFLGGAHDIDFSNEFTVIVDVGDQRELDLGISSGITRDAEVANVLDGVTISDETLTFSRFGAPNIDIDLPTGGGGGGSGGETLILDGSSFATDPTSLTVTNWRNYDALSFVFHDTSSGGVGAHQFDWFLTTTLDTDGSIRSGLSQNEGATFTETAGSDVIAIDFYGSTPTPSTGDTMDVYGINFGGGGGGGGGATTFAALTDTPSAITAAECLVGNSGGTALVFSECDPFQGPSEFSGTLPQAARFITHANAANHYVTFETLTGLIAPPANRLLLVGGDDGQILAKSADTNYSVEWIDAPSGGGGGQTYTFGTGLGTSGDTVFVNLETLSTTTDPLAADDEIPYVNESTSNTQKTPLSNLPPVLADGVNVVASGGRYTSRPITRGPTPSPGSANRDYIYADHATLTDFLSYKRDGTETEIHLHASDLRLGWVGYSSITGEFTRGGAIRPFVPVELRVLIDGDEEGQALGISLEPQADPDDNVLLGATRGADPATITIFHRLASESSFTSTTLVRQSLDSRGFRPYREASEAAGTRVFEPGEEYIVRFRRAGASTNAALHIGDHMIEIATENHLAELRADLESFAVAAAEGHTEDLGLVTGIDGGTAIRIDDGGTETPEVNFDMGQLTVATTMASADTLVMRDVSADSHHEITKSNLAGSLDGTGLVATGGQLALQFSELTVDTTPQSSDSFPFADSGGSSERRMAFSVMRDNIRNGLNITNFHDYANNDYIRNGDEFAVWDKSQSRVERYDMLGFVSGLVGSITTAGHGLAIASESGDEGRITLHVRFDDTDEITDLAEDDLIGIQDQTTADNTVIRHMTAAGFLDAVSDDTTIERNGTELRVKDDGIGQDQLADDSVGVPQLKIGSGGTTWTSTGDNRLNNADLNRYSFFPRLSGTVDGTPDCRVNDNMIVALGAPANRARLRVRTSLSSGESCTISWEFMTNSDDPSVWVALNSEGEVVSIFESEDDSDIAPLSVPFDSSGVPLPGYTVLHVGLPTFSVVERVYTTVLTDSERAEAMTCSSDYFLRRGWLSEPWTTLIDTLNVPTRYEPSSRQWLMRCAAEATGKITNLFYLDELVVTGGAWDLRQTP